MLADSKNQDLYAEWIDYIEDPKTKQAFRYIVGVAAASVEFVCYPQLKGASGPVKDFRFFDSEGEQRFAFITNKKWLLFYFRPPALRSQRYSRECLISDFSSFVETPAGEWTVKLSCVDDVVRLCKHIDPRQAD